MAYRQSADGVEILDIDGIVMPDFLQEIANMNPCVVFAIMPRSSPRIMRYIDLGFNTHEGPQLYKNERCVIASQSYGYLCKKHLGQWP